MFRNFALDSLERAEIEADFEVLHAYYEYEDYSGRAFVVLRSRVDGGLWEVNGSHCSCYGLEDQWDLESTTFEALAHRNKARPLPGMEGQGMRKLAAFMEARELGSGVVEGGQRLPSRSL
jgi:hypothetical protein